MKKAEMIRLKTMLSRWKAKKRPVPGVDGQMRQVVLDVARHPLRDLFLNHHSNTHKSSVVI